MPTTSFLFRSASLLLLLALNACSGGGGSPGQPGGSAPGSISWALDTGAEIYYSSPALGADGTIYVGNGLRGEGNCGLFALAPDGRLKWKFSGPRPFFSPVVASDGTVYVQDDTSTLVALTPGGSEKWRHVLSASAGVGQSTPALGLDGTVYLTADGLLALTPEGQLRWRYPAQSGAVIRTAPAIARDGMIVVAATREGEHPEVWALNPNGTLRWRLVLNDALFTYSSPALGADGTIYVGAERSQQESGFVYAIGADGRERWKYVAEGRRVIRAAPVLGPDGTIYVGTKATDAATDFEAQMLALRPDGTLKWRYPVRQETSTPDDIYGSAAIGSDGSLFFGAETGRLYALDPSGALLWKSSGGGNWTSPALGSDGTLYIGSNDGKLYAIRTATTGLSASSWPKFHGDNRNSGLCR